MPVSLKNVSKLLNGRDLQRLQICSLHAKYPHNITFLDPGMFLKTPELVTCIKRLEDITQKSGLPLCLHSCLATVT